MPISVDLQDPFSYSYLPIVITIAAIVASVIVLVAIIILRKRLKGTVKVKKKKQEVFKPRNKEEIRKDYLGKIDKIEQKYKDGSMDVRTTHQELSAVVRMFVHDMTGINAQNFSLNELKEQKITSISGLIEEFYNPEFALRTDKETNDSIRDARTVISSWT